MSAPEVEDDIYSLQAKITTQQSLVRQLKKDGAPADKVLAEVAIMTEFRAKMAALEAKEVKRADAINRKAFDDLILRKMYVVKAFEIHDGPAGLFDYGPPGCALKANVLALWRKHFALEEAMLEMDCTNLTPSSVLEASGHVERFTDFMVKDEKTGDCFRADKLLEDVIDQFLAANPNISIQEKDQHLIIQRQADAFDADELYDMLMKYNTKSPTNPSNEITRPFPFNLMFRTTIGPEGTQVGFLRPETAQGLFVNFRRLLDYNSGRMPFAAAQIGLGFRNEIAPRNGLLRVREFCMAEIEHFVDPSDKNHPKFSSVKDIVLVLFPQDAQLGTGRTIPMTAGEAVAKGVINNETLAYFMARTQTFMVKIGIDPTRMRFRQHLRTEMAHYAADCWDLEIHMSYGWIECVGHADRSCYDLEQHSKKTGVPLLASKRLDAPILVDKVIAEANKRLIGPKFKLDQKTVINAIESLDGADLDKFKAEIESVGKSTIKGFEVTADLVTFKAEKKTISEVKFVPSVIEPSYGIGRILYAVMEHAFSQRNGDEQRCVMSLKPCVAPIKVGIYPLLNKPQFEPIVNKLHKQFIELGISTKVDSTSGTVGRRYARSDELGVPFGVTVDFDTLIDDSVTLRDRNTMAQIRVSLDKLVGIVKDLSEENITWSDLVSKYPVITSSAGDDENEGDASAAGGGAAASVDTTSSTIVQKCVRASFSRPNPNFKA